MNLEEHKIGKGKKHARNITFYCHEDLVNRWINFIKSNNLNGSSVLRHLMMELLDKEGA